MDKAKGKALAAYLICALFSVFSATALLLILIGLHKKFSFFTVVSGGRLFFYLLMVLLPLIVGVLLIVFYRKVGKRTKTTLFALLATSVVISFVFIIAFLIMPPCASETNNPENYLIFDESCPASDITYNGLLPSEIPSECENVRYFYTYSNYPDLHYDVFAQWSLPREKYNAEKERLVSLFPESEVETIGDYSVVFISDEKKTTLDHIAFAFNDKNFTVRYMVSYIENVDVNGIAPYYEGLAW